jgi:hypothetical protein
VIPKDVDATKNKSIYNKDIKERINKESLSQIQSSFNLSNELNKIHVNIPLNELVKIPYFREDVNKFIGASSLHKSNK